MRTNCFRCKGMEGAKRKKGEQSENQEGDVPRNYIRLGSGDAVEWKEAHGSARFCEIQESRGDRQLRAATLGKSRRGEG